MRYPCGMMSLVSVLMLAACAPAPVTPVSVGQPAPLIDAATYSIAVDLRVTKQALEIVRVELVQGAARGYGFHPDQLRVSAKGDREMPSLEVRTYDPRWQRIILPQTGTSLKAGGLQSESPAVQGRVPEGPPSSGGDVAMPSRAIRERWVMRDAAEIRVFLPFRSDLHTIEAEIVEGPRAKPLSLAVPMKVFCEKNQEYCDRRAAR